jgi:hypothetical protein
MPAQEQKLPRRAEKTEKPGGAALQRALVRSAHCKERRPRQTTGKIPAWPQGAGYQHPSAKGRPGQPGGGEAGRGMCATGRKPGATGMKSQPSRWIATAGKGRRKRSHRPALGEGFRGASFRGLDVRFANLHIVKRYGALRLIEDSQLPIRRYLASSQPFSHSPIASAAGLCGCCNLRPFIGCVLDAHAPSIGQFVQSVKGQRV